MNRLADDSNVDRPAKLPSSCRKPPCELQDSSNSDLAVLVDIDATEVSERPGNGRKEAYEVALLGLLVISPCRAYMPISREKDRMEVLLALESGFPIVHRQRLARVIPLGLLPDVPISLWVVFARFRL